MSEQHNDGGEGIPQEWVYAIQKIIHEDVPRFSVYTFKNVSSKFSIDQYYVEGIANWSLLFILCMLVSVLLIIGSVFVLHLNVIGYTRKIVTIYKSILFAFGFLAFVGAIVGFVGYTIINNSLRKIIKNQLDPGLAIIKEFYDYISLLIKNAFGLLRDTKKHLENSESEGSWLEQIASKGINAIALPILTNILKNEKHVKQIETTVTEILEMVEVLKAVIRNSLALGVVFMLITILGTAWITFSAFSRKGTGSIVCRVGAVLVIIWWIFGAILMPVTLFTSDICYNPVAVIAHIANWIHPDIDEGIILYYGNCEEPNPLEQYLAMLHTGITYILGPLSKVITMMGFLDPNGQTLQILKGAKSYMDYVLENGGCKWSSTKTKEAFEEICSHFVIGLTFMTLATIVIPASLTLAVVACIRLRDFKGWPKERHYPCPETCHVHREFKEPPEPCRPRPIRSEIIWPKPKVHDRRITCPITCRGHDGARAELELRTTCGPRCRGMIPSEPPKKPRVLPRHLQKHYIKQKADKQAICCIELYKDIECEQEASICECHPEPKTTPCGAYACKMGEKSKALLKTCGLHKCRIKKKQRQRALRTKGEKIKAAIPGLPAMKNLQAMARARLKRASKCGFDVCKKKMNISDKIPNCGALKCKRRRRRQPKKAAAQKQEPLPDEKPVNPAEPAGGLPVTKSKEDAKNKKAKKLPKPKKEKQHKSKQIKKKPSKEQKPAEACVPYVPDKKPDRKQIKK